MNILSRIVLGSSILLCLEPVICHATSISVTVVGGCKPILRTIISSDPSECGFVVRDHCDNTKYLLSFKRYKSIFNNPKIWYGPFGVGDQLPRISYINKYGTLYR